MVTHRLGKTIAEGKTKIIRECEHDPELVIITSKDDITAGDGAKHDLLEGKAALATETTCNVFRLLRARGIPTAFRQQLGTNMFSAVKCEMRQLEVVGRIEAHGSYLKRYPTFEKGYKFSEPLIEFFLKTADKVWNGRKIPVDDPLMVLEDGVSKLYIPNIPMEGQQPFHTIDGYPPRWEEMQSIATETFTILSGAWAKLGCTMVDFKVEFGIDAKNNLLLADVIDNDSWRLVEDEKYLDKQVYRDGGSLEETMEKYRRVAALTRNFVATSMLSA